MELAVFSSKSYDREFLNKFNFGNKHKLTYFDTSLNSNTTNLTLGFNAICVFVNDKIDKETVEKLSENGVKIIALRCAGFNNVDIVTTTEKNIKVVRVSAYSPNAVAEHAMALVLTLNRKTHKAYNRIKESNFSLEKLIGFNLYGKTVGVIGTGRIGSVFCKIMLGFGCKVIACDLIESNDLQVRGVEYKLLDEVIHNSDIISLHCPLTPETHHLIDSNMFLKMKKGTMLINTSRGAVIKTSDTVEALKNGTLGYLGIDVYEQEENLFFKDLSESIIQDDLILKLMSFPNVLITSHQGFLTKEALEQISVKTLDNISNFENGLPLENEVKIERIKN